MMYYGFEKVRKALIFLAIHSKIPMYYGFDVLTIPYFQCKTLTQGCQVTNKTIRCEVDVFRVLAVVSEDNVGRISLPSIRIFINQSTLKSTIMQYKITPLSNQTHFLKCIIIIRQYIRRKTVTGRYRTDSPISSPNVYIIAVYILTLVYTY